MNSPLLARLSYLTGLSTAPSTVDVDLAAAVLKSEAQRARALAARAALTARQQAAVFKEAANLSPAMAMYRRKTIVAKGIYNRLESHELSRVPSGKVIGRHLATLDAKIKIVVSAETTTEGAQPSPIRQRAGGE